MSNTDTDRPQAGSLDSYMREMVREREESTSERFSLPFFPTIEVELRLSDHKREFGIGDRNRKKIKDRGDRLLYTMADVIAETTVGFHVNDKAVEGVDNSWNGLCLKAYPEATTLNLRQAIIRLLTSDGVSALYGQYQDWREGRAEGGDPEAEADLGATL